MKLWVEKYRPKKVEDYVFRDDSLKSQVMSWIENKSIPHLLLHGSAGTGKSSLARLLISEIGIDSADILYINVSDQSGVDVIRDKVISFVSVYGFGTVRVVLLEEADFASASSQAALRRIMEDYSNSVRFILTANHYNKIIPALQSRCQTVEINKLDKDSFKIRMIQILANENINVEDMSTIDTFVKASYPDLRKCINLMQQHSMDGTLNVPSEKNSSSDDWKITAIEMFNKGKISDARNLICSQIRSEEYEDFYRLCYENMQWWGECDDKRDSALLIIRDALVKHSFIADPEINLSAMLTQLSHSKNEERSKK